MAHVIKAVPSQATHPPPTHSSLEECLGPPAVWLCSSHNEPPKFSLPQPYVFSGNWTNPFQKEFVQMSIRYYKLPVILYRVHLCIF